MSVGAHHKRPILAAPAEVEAKFILEHIMHRRNAPAATRDALVARLEAFARAEARGQAALSRAERARNRSEAEK
jgi:hypothetical protein